MKAPISVCIITRDCADDLDTLLDSIEDHVEEVCVLDTGSVDLDATARVCAGRAHLDVDKSFLDEDGFMSDFSAARTRSFAMASKPWLMWLDCDDTLVGGETLGQLIECGDLDREKNGPGIAIRLEYAYTFDDSGMCTQHFFRERIVHADDGWHWHRPVHEYLTRDGDDTRQVRISPRDVHVRHMQPPKGGVGMRNLRILLSEWGRGSDDPAIPYYIGNELEVRGLFDRAIEWFDECVSIDLPKDHPGRHWQATSLEHKSICMLNFGLTTGPNMWKPHEALDAALKLVRLFPDMRMGYMLSGRALLCQGEFALAVEAFNKAYALEEKVRPSFPNPVLENKTMRLIASESCHRAGEEEMAREHLLEAVRFAGSDDPQVLLTAARLGIELEAA